MLFNEFRSHTAYTIGKTGRRKTIRIENEIKMSKCLINTSSREVIYYNYLDEGELICAI